MTDQSTRCILCPDKTEIRWSSSDAPAIVPCPSCGVPTNVPPPSRDVFSDGIFFDGTYAGERLKYRPMWLQQAGLRLAWIQSFLRSGRLLEIGSATGEFVATAEKAGFDVTGVDSSEWAANASRDITNSVIRADVGEWLQRNEGVKFDGIVMLHMLEHVDDPRSFLKPLVNVLAPDGFIFIELPNGDARDIRDGAKWRGAAHEEHYVHFRKQDMDRLLESVGLRCHDAQPFSMKQYASRAGWAIMRLKALSRGSLTPSEDFLRVVAVHR